MKSNFRCRFLVRFVAASLIAVAVCSAGCRPSDSNPPVAEASYDASHFILAEEPAGGINVIAARETSQDSEEVVLIGRIGGGLNPWVEGRAAFQVVDASVLACSDEKEDGEVCSCPTPWDYCCETDKLPKAMALVQFIDSDGSVVKADAKKSFGIQELQTVVVKGTAKRDDVGNLTVMASGIYVRK